MKNVEISLNNPLIRIYLFYTLVLVLKVLLMAILTGLQRFKRMAFTNPEDCSSIVFSSKLKPRIDENVERVRRAHLNDLENIPLFFVTAFIYILTNPSVAWATMLFRVYTIARIVHTIVYAVVVIPQPARALSWGTGYLITGYMAIQSLLYFS